MIKKPLQQMASPCYEMKGKQNFKLVQEVMWGTWRVLHIFNREGESGAQEGETFRRDSY